MEPPAKANLSSNAQAKFDPDAEKKLREKITKEVTQDIKERAEKKAKEDALAEIATVQRQKDASLKLKQN